MIKVNSFPDERIVQLVLPGFQHLISEQCFDISQSDHDESDIEKPQPPAEAQLILPGFEELMLPSKA